MSVRDQIEARIEAGKSNAEIVAELGTGERYVRRVRAGLQAGLPPSVVEGERASYQPKAPLPGPSEGVPLPTIADSLALRRATDEAAGLRRRVAELEGALIAEQDWRGRMDCLKAARLEPVDWAPKAPHVRKANSLTPVLFSSDFQVGEVIKAEELDGMNSYDADIFCERYQAMIEKTITLAENNTGATDFPGCIYLRGGDAISGEIHDELAQTNDLSSIPAVRLVQRQEREGIRRLRDRFGRVRVISVPGNHGRTTHKPHSKGYTERSYETLLTWWLADSFDHDPNVEFWQPPSGDALFDVCGWNVLLSHGDRTGSKGGQGFVGPAATIARGHQKLLMNYAMSGRHVDVILTGHLHTSLKLATGYANGSLAGYNEYARSFRAMPDAAKQWLLFIHERHCVSHAFELQLSDRPQRVAREFQL